MTSTWFHGRNLTDVTRVARRTHTFKPGLFVHTSCIVATRTTLTKVNLNLASRAEIVEWTVAEEVGRERMTRGTVQTRIRVAVVNGRFAVGASEAGRACAIDRAINGRATQSVVATYARVAQIDERIAASSRVAYNQNKN